MMKIQHIAIERLKPNRRNARVHPEQQIDQLAEIIRQYGFIAPIVVDENYGILAGHARYRAAKQLGLATVPVVQVCGLSAAKKRALALADNKIAENAGWDRELLAVELSELSELLIEEGLDISITGFAVPEIERILPVSEEDSSDPVDAIDSRWLSEKPVSQPGDLWILGDHRALCADARDRDTLARLMGQTHASMAFFDPFQNDRAMASGELAGESIKPLISALAAAASVSHEGAVHYVRSDWRHIGQLLEASQRVYGAMLNLAVWVKSDDGGEGPLYRSQHELIGVFRVGGELRPNKRRRLRSNVWRYANKTSPTGQLDRPHLSITPVALVADAMKDVTRKGEIVIDPVAGFGTTIIAAERVGRHARAIEVDPRSVDIAVRRWQALTRREAVHAELGLTLNELARRRHVALASAR